MANLPNGVFMGTTMLQTNNQIGGARSVFVKLQGVKNDLVFPTHGGQLANPFKGTAKIFAGDLMEYRPNSDGIHPSIYLLKTYKVKSQASTKVVIYKDGFKHIPFVGDILMKAPETLGGTGKAYTVTAVSVTSGGDWELTFSTAIDSVSDGDVLVEGATVGASAKMLVERINAVAPCDYDCFYDPAVSSSDFEGARYLLAPALAATMYTKRMSPVPDCVKPHNKCDIPGWFKVDALSAPVTGAASAAAIASLADDVASIESRVDAIDTPETGSIALLDARVTALEEG